MSSNSHNARGHCVSFSQELMAALKVIPSRCTELAVMAVKVWSDLKDN
jgi:hypothetical protein